jgi:hypothetical protein
MKNLSLQALDVVEEKEEEGTCTVVSTVALLKSLDFANQDVVSLRISARFLSWFVFSSLLDF